MHKGMSSGTIVSLLAPTANQILFSDISMTLSSLLRFGGQTDLNDIPVIRHIVHTAMISDYLYDNDQRMRQLMLMHDLHEAYIGEIVTPMKQAIAEIAGFNVIGRMEHVFDIVLYEIAGIDRPTPEEAEKMRYVDQLACLFEASILNSIDISDWDFPAALVKTATVEVPNMLPFHRDWVGTFNSLVAADLPQLFDWEGGK